MRELSWQPEQAAALSILGDGERAGAAQILELTGKRLRVATTLPAKGGDAVRLTWDGQLVLGQVLDAGPGGFWIEIQHMLLETAGH